MKWLMGFVVIAGLWALVFGLGVLDRVPSGHGTPQGFGVAVLVVVGAAIVIGFGRMLGGALKPVAGLLVLLLVVAAALLALHGHNPRALLSAVSPLAGR